MRHGGTLGRVEFFDPRNMGYTIAGTQPTDIVRVQAAVGAVIATRSTDPARDRRMAGLATENYEYPSPFRDLDQMDMPACTGFSAVKAMSAGPKPRKFSGPNGATGEATRLYAKIVTFDQSEGRYFDGGATMLALAKALKAEGWISAYRWGYTLADYIMAMRTGGCLLGIPWLTGMDDPDPKWGVIKAVGTVRGGHAIFSDGADFDDGIARLDNTWGVWGKNGHAYLPFRDLERLLGDGGEILVLEKA